MKGYLMRIKVFENIHYCANSFDERATRQSCEIEIFEIFVVGFRVCRKFEKYIAIVSLILLDRYM